MIHKNICENPIIEFFWYVSDFFLPFGYCRDREEIDEQVENVHDDIDAIMNKVNFFAGVFRVETEKE